MINRNYVTPVGASNKPPVVPKKELSQKELTTWLRKRGHAIALGTRLKGGAVSDVYQATDSSGKPIIVKYTFDTADPDPTVQFLSADEHFIDTQLLRFLTKTDGVRVPQVLHVFDDLPVTIMEDMRSSGFTLLESLLTKGSLPLNTAEDIGHSIAKMLVKFAEHPEFETGESAYQIYYEYGQELRHAYPDQAWYNRLEKRLTTANQQLMLVDTHPKNLFVDTAGKAAWIDFGRSVWGDRDFALPNFLADTIIYALAGYIPKDHVATFVETTVAAYRELLPIDDEVLCTYMAGEVIQRWNGRWIDGIDTTERKLEILTFGMSVFDKKLFTLKALLDELRRSKSVQKTKASV